MRALLVFLALAAALVLGLWFTGAFSDPEVADPDAGDGTSSTSTDGDTPSSLRASNVPTARPPLELTAFPKNSRALYVGRATNVDGLFMLQLLGTADNSAYQSWYLNAGGDNAQGRARGMDQVPSMPTGDHLAENEISLVILDNIDPADLPDEFWISLEERVRSGQTGLLFKAYWPLQGIEGSMTVHPALTHTRLSDLLPVKEAEPIAGRADGGGVPGLFKERQPFEVTKVGATHPASRLVRWEKWSRDWWTSFRSGVMEDDAWLGAQFVYPVVEIKDGAETLVGVESPESDPIPAIIVGPESGGRVAWVGVPQLGWRAQYNPKDKANMGAIYQNLMAWLAGAELAESEASED